MSLLTACQNYILLLLVSTWPILKIYDERISTSRPCRPDFAQAIKVEPEPANGSRTMSRVLLEFLTARSTSATGFIVGWRSLRVGLS